MSGIIGQDYAEPEPWQLDPHADAPPAPSQPPAPASLARLMLDGARFLLDVPPTPVAVWGEGTAVLWAAGEALMVTGGSGVGKTTLAGQLVRGRLGLAGQALGLPVRLGARRVLYLAMDRPSQARRALARVFGPDDRGALAERLIVWQGPPPVDLAREPSVLREMCEDAAADTVVVDSLKDAAVGLSDDAVAAGYNRARQDALAAGVEVLELHHNVKRGEKGAPPTTLADVYGSTWLTSGAGSVIGLHGEPGDPVVQFRHLKQPMDTLGPWTVIHDHDAGTSSVQERPDILAVARACGSITVHGAAAARFATEKPTAAQQETARRDLARLVKAGLLLAPDPTPGKPTIYRPAVVGDVEEPPPDLFSGGP